MEEIRLTPNAQKIAQVPESSFEQFRDSTITFKQCLKLQQQRKQREKELNACKSIDHGGMVLDRLVAGRIKETRIIMDTLGLMTRLGVVPPPPA